MPSLFSDDHPRATLNIYIITLLPIIASYVPFIVLTILHLVVNTPIVQVIVRTIKISQFIARLTPILTKLDLSIVFSPHRIVWNILNAAYVFWSSRSWLEILCLAVKEVLKWNGVPQELFDTLNDVVGSSWLLNILSSAPSSSSAAAIGNSADLWTPTLDKPFQTYDLAVGFSPAVGGLNVSG